MEKVRNLEQRLLGPAGRQHLNEISDLFTLCESEDLRLVAAALSSVSKALAHHRKLTVELAGEADRSAEQELVKWLRQHGEALRSLLLQLAGSGQTRAQVCAVRLQASLLRDEALEMSLSTKMSGDELARLFGLARPELQIQTLLTELLLAPRWNSQVVDCLMSEYVREYDDFRHYMMSHLRSCAEQVGKVSREPGSEVSKDTTVTDKGEEAEPPTKRKRLHGPFAEAAFQKGRSAEELFERLLALLKQAPEPDPVKAQDEEVTGELLLPTSRPLGHYRREYRKLFQEAWLKLLGLRVPLVHCSALLQLLPTSVIPHLSRPLLLSDFYLRAFHAGSLDISVLALSGLLLLLTRYGLGDPETLSASCGEFYSQLYSLLRPATFRLKRRARFQRLAAAALTSGLLPGGFAAAFAKKCLRVAIALPEPGSILWLLSLAYGLIQRNHSHCSFLLHREEIEGMSNLTKDTFDSEADLTQATKQVASSSLWEVQLLFRHHLPAVSTLAKLFERPFFKPTSRKLDPEIFLDQSVAKAYEQALKSADRQAARLKARGTTCPLAFQVEDDPLVLRVSGWAAALSTGQRRIGAGL